MIVAPVALVMHQPDLGTSLMILVRRRLHHVPRRPALAHYRRRSDRRRRRRDLCVFRPAARIPARPRWRPTSSSASPRIRWAPAITLCSRRSLSARLASSAAAGCRVRKASSTSCPRNTPTSIFTMIVEEFGLLGGALVLGLFGALMALTMQVALQSRSLFGKLAASGVAATLACYVFINTAMVIGLVPRGRHSAADHQLRRHRHGHADGRLRDCALDRLAPRPAWRKGVVVVIPLAPAVRRGRG